MDTLKCIPFSVTSTGATSSLEVEEEGELGIPSPLLHTRLLPASPTSILTSSSDESAQQFHEGMIQPKNVEDLTDTMYVQYYGRIHPAR